MKEPPYKEGKSPKQLYNIVFSDDDEKRDTQLFSASRGPNKIPIFTPKSVLLRQAIEGQEAAQERQKKGEKVNPDELMNNRELANAYTRHAFNCTTEANFLKRAVKNIKTNRALARVADPNEALMPALVEGISPDTKNLVKKALACDPDNAGAHALYAITLDVLANTSSNPMKEKLKAMRHYAMADVLYGPMALEEVIDQSNHVPSHQIRCDALIQELGPEIYQNYHKEVLDRFVQEDMARVFELSINPEKHSVVAMGEIIAKADSIFTALQTHQGADPIPNLPDHVPGTLVWRKLNMAKNLEKTVFSEPAEDRVLLERGRDGTEKYLSKTDDKELTECMQRGLARQVKAIVKEKVFFEQLIQNSNKTNTFPELQKDVEKSILRQYLPVKDLYTMRELNKASAGQPVSKDTVKQWQDNAKKAATDSWVERVHAIGKNEPQLGQ